MTFFTTWTNFDHFVLLTPLGFQGLLPMTLWEGLGEYSSGPHSGVAGSTPQDSTTGFQGLLPKPIGGSWRRCPTSTFLLLYCNVLYCTVLYCTVLYCTAQYCTVLYSIVQYCTVLYCAVLHSTVLYYFVLYCTVLYIFLNLNFKQNQYFFELEPMTDMHKLLDPVSIWG